MTDRLEQIRQLFPKFNANGLEPALLLFDENVTWMAPRGRIKGSDQQIQQRASWVMDFGPDGRVTHLCAYFSWEEALEAARGE